MNEKRENKDYMLVQECLRGSEEAWREFYSRFIGLMRSVVRRRMNLPSSDVQDIVQAAFLELTTALRNYDSEQALHTFVCLVTQRVLIDEYRKAKAAKRNADTESVEHHDGNQEVQWLFPIWTRKTTSLRRQRPRLILEPPCSSWMRNAGS
jgi:RNA polymerase sigma factor (sigma-70 family)